MNLLVVEGERHSSTALSMSLIQGVLTFRNMLSRQDRVILSRIGRYRQPPGLAEFPVEVVHVEPVNV